MKSRNTLKIGRKKEMRKTKYDRLPRFSVYDSISGKTSVPGERTKGLDGLTDSQRGNTGY